MLTVVESIGVSGLEQLHAELASFNTAKALFIAVDKDNEAYLFAHAPELDADTGLWWGQNGDVGQRVAIEFAQRLGLVRGGVGVVTLAFDAAPEVG